MASARVWRGGRCGFGPEAPNLRAFGFRKRIGPPGIGVEPKENPPPGGADGGG